MKLNFNFFLVLHLILIINIIQARSFKDLTENTKFNITDIDRNQIDDEANDSFDGRKPKKNCTTQRLCSIISKVNIIKSQVSTIDSNINVGFSNAEIDVEEIKELQEVESSKLDDCCFTLNSKINRLNKEINNGFRTIDQDLDEILEVQEEQSSKLDNCCFSLNSKIDALVIPSCDLSTVTSKLDSCCTQLNSSADSVENVIESCCQTLNSKLDAFEAGSCNLSTLTSKLDVCCDQVSSKVDALTLCDAIPITSPTLITVSGHYCLAQDLIFGISTISISATTSNVVIDLNGHTLFSPIVPAISLNPGAQNNITIENGTIVGSGINIPFLAMGEHNNIKIRNVIITQAVGLGINASSINNLIIENCILQNNGVNLNLSNIRNSQILNTHCTLSPSNEGALIDTCQNLQIKECMFNQNGLTGLEIRNVNGLLIEKSMFNNNGITDSPFSFLNSGAYVKRGNNIEINECIFNRSTSSLPFSNQKVGLYIQSVNNLMCENCMFNENAMIGAEIDGASQQCRCIKFLNCQANGNTNNGLLLFTDVADAVFDTCLTCSNEIGFYIRPIISFQPASNVCILNSTAKSNGTGFFLQGGSGLIKENQAIDNDLCGFDDMVATTSNYKYVANIAIDNGNNPAGIPMPIDTNYCISSGGSPFTPNGPGAFPYRQVNLDTPPASYWNNITLR